MLMYNGDVGNPPRAVRYRSGEVCKHNEVLLPDGSEAPGLPRGEECLESGGVCSVSRVCASYYWEAAR